MPLINIFHSMPPFEEFKKIVNDKNKSLDSAINEAIDETKNTPATQTEKSVDAKEYD